MSQDDLPPPPFRVAAEAWFAGEPPVAVSAVPLSIDELSHELRVREVQLEMQAEALRASQLALALARSRYAELYDSAPVGYLTLTRGGLIAEANIAAATLLGVARKQLLDERFDRFVVSADVDRWQRLFAAAIVPGGRQALELALKSADGALSARQVELHCRCVDSDAGPTLRMTLTDVSGRHATEDLLRKLSLAVEQSPESIVITNLAGEIEYVNEAFVRIAGYPREKLIGRNMSILQSGKTPRETYAEMWDALSHGRHWKGDFINRREDGSEYVESAIITPLRQPDGRITHYVAVKADITGKPRRGRKLAATTRRQGAW